MYYDSNSDGIGLDLTPLVSAGQSAADSYAKIRAADAAVAAAKRRAAPAPAPMQAQPTRRINPLAYVLMGVAVIGGFMIMRNVLGKRRR